MQFLDAPPTSSTDPISSALLRARVQLRISSSHRLSDLPVAAQVLLNLTSRISIVMCQEKPSPTV